MIEWIRELRRREVFRTLGLYVGISWIVIEAASILVPAFDGPGWIVRSLVIVAVAGLPVVGVLAWVYDLTRRGVQRDHGDVAVPAFGGRKMDFVVIGVLSLALIFSGYLNIRGDPESVGALEPVAVLIADFENATDQSVFDGVLEQALHIGIEGAPHVTSWDRNLAASVAATVGNGGDGLPPAAARLVAIREDVDLVLAGTLTALGNGFSIEVQALEPVSGEARFTASTRAGGRDAVLAAVGSLAVSVRRELGDAVPDSGADATVETFTAASIEAAKAYVDAAKLSFDGRLEESIELFRRATQLDPEFGRAFSGWATSEFLLGRIDAAEEQWQKALSLMGTMTERERLRTIGTYYVGVTGNYEQAVETFSELVEKYPADYAGLNNLAVASFLSLDFEGAAAVGRRVLEIFPDRELYRSNYALYSMYAGDFDSAAATAAALVEAYPEYGTGWLPLAIARLEQGDYAGAREAWHAMAEATRSPHRRSTAVLGLADVAIFLGELDTAQTLLADGIRSDLDDNSSGAAAVKQLALAESLLSTGDHEAAAEAARRALEISAHDSARIAAALVFLRSGDVDAAADIGEELSGELNTHNRAYAAMIEGLVQSAAGAHIEAIQTLREAAALADLWRIRFELGRAYLEAGFFAEAFDELQGCVERRGEATAMFLDDTPTYRHLADLPYWLGRAQDALGMQSDAQANYRAYLERRSVSPLADDARARLQ